MASAIVLLVSLVALSLRYPDIRRAAGNAVVAEIRRMSLFVTFTLRERLSRNRLGHCRFAGGPNRLLDR
jgi:hypothetical protein